ncbi:MAG: AAA family ATPase [Legionellales bacterium]|nr:AAA family ATPase [Legionellales bacterium]
MTSALTQYGVDDLQIILGAFSDLGTDILSGVVTEHIKAVNKKELRKFKMKEACEMTERSDAFLRKLEQADPSFEPEKINGIRYYTLELINRIRDKAGTRYKRPAGSDPIIIAISHFKGGVGKSTTTKAMADKFALSGLRVLGIGMDGQGTDALYYGFIPDLDISPEETIRSALLNDPSSIKKLIKNTYFNGIDIIPGNLTLTQVEIKLTDYKDQINQVKKLGFPDERLANALKFIKDDYDVILLDCGPNLNILTLNAINACNALLIPVPPALPDLASFCTYCKTLREHLEFSGKTKTLEFFRVLVTKHPKNKPSENILKLMLKEFGSYVMQKHIVYSAEIERAAANFCSLYELPSSSQKTYQRGLESMEGVFGEILDAFKQIWEAAANEVNEDVK